MIIKPNFVLTILCFAYYIAVLAVCRREGFPPNTIDGTIAAI
jgi:hypothetical protein